MKQRQALPLSGDAWEGFHDGIARRPRSPRQPRLRENPRRHTSTPLGGMAENAERRECHAIHRLPGRLDAPHRPVVGRAAGDNVITGVFRARWRLSRYLGERQGLATMRGLGPGCAPATAEAHRTVDSSHRRRRSSAVPELPSANSDGIYPVALLIAGRRRGPSQGHGNLSGEDPTCQTVATSDPRATHGRRSTGSSKLPGGSCRPGTNSTSPVAPRPLPREGGHGRDVCVRRAPWDGLRSGKRM